MGEGRAGRWQGIWKARHGRGCQPLLVLEIFPSRHKCLDGAPRDGGGGRRGAGSDVHQRLERTKRGSSEQVCLWAPSPGAEMGALCPMWMAHRCQVC